MKKILLTSILFGALMLTATGASSRARFGTYCQQKFQNNWQTGFNYAWARCSRFNNELDDTDTKVFYRNLHGAKDEFEVDNDQNGMERVHLVYVNTHGGYMWHGRKNAVWAMWNNGVVARSKSMYLGNENYKLSILASYACQTHKTSDDGVWVRWIRIFKGGLRISTGSHGTLWDGYTTDECGEDFADDLQGRMKIKYAWKSALSDWKVDQDVAVFASGTSANNCHSRKNHMKWQNFGSYPRLRNNNVHKICWTTWNNL